MDLMKPILQGALLLPLLFLAVVAVPTLALAIHQGEWPVKGWWPVIALASLVVLGGIWGAVAACTPPEPRRRR